jgi:hypothetical protein
VSIILFVHFGSVYTYHLHHAAVAAADQSVSSSPLPLEERRRQILSKSGRLETIPSSPLTSTENNHHHHHHLHHQQQRRRLDECYETEKDNWHIAMVGKNTCTNSNKFPPSWLNPSMASFFASTCEDCCTARFPKLPRADCNCDDVCNEGGKYEEDEASSCSGLCCDRRYWHPVFTAAQPLYTCTNTYTDDGSYPPYWNDNPLMVGTSMFKTVDDCCEKLTNGEVDRCVIIEAEECKTAADDNTDSTTDTEETNTTEEEAQCKPGAKCFEAGSQCTDGSETCCGETHDSLKCTCTNDGIGGLTYMCYSTDACMMPSCCRGLPSKDLPYPPSPDTCQSVGQLCETGEADDFCCRDFSSGSTYCTKSGGKVSETDAVDTPTPRPTLHLTIPPHLLKPPETPKPTLLFTIPPHLLEPDVTPKPTVASTPPPQLPIAPPPQDMVQNSSPLQDHCSKFQRRKSCLVDDTCKWDGVLCKAKGDSSSITPEPDTSTTNICTNGFKWHRGKSSQGSTCSNDQNYPRAWDDPKDSTKRLFDSPEECCLVHFTLETCVAINACGVPLTLGSSSTSTSGNSVIVAMTEAVPSSDGSSSSGGSNCSGNKRRRFCKLDPSCNWNWSEGVCVAEATTMQQTLSFVGTEAPACSRHGRKRRACSSDTNCTWDTQVAKCVATASTVENMG